MGHYPVSVSSLCPWVTTKQQGKAETQPTRLGSSALLLGDFTQPPRAPGTAPWLCWWCVTWEGGLLPCPQPPASPAMAKKARYMSLPNPGGLIQGWWFKNPSISKGWHDGSFGALFLTLGNSSQ